MSGDDTSAPGTPVSFEEALGRLDRIVARLEGGEVGLEEALQLFEEGQRQVAVCRERLTAAKERIEELTGTSGDRPNQDAGDENPF